MNTSLTKIALLCSVSLLFSSTLSVVHAAESDADELTELLDQLLADEPTADTKDEPEVPSTQSAEDVQKNLQAEEEDKNKSKTEKMLDAELGEDHDSAQDILDEDEKWTYSNGQESKITIGDTTENSTNITVSKVLYDGDELLKYRIYYSEKTLASQTLSLIKDTVVTKKDDPKDANMVQLTLNNLKPNTKYYVVVSPVHPEDDTIEPLEVITKEVSFSTKAPAPVKEEVKEEDSKEDTAKEDEKEEANNEPKEEVKKDYITNITNTVKDNEVVVRWNKNMPDVSKVEVTLRHTGESKFTTIGTPAFKEGIFTFKVTKIGTYFLKLKALDAQGNMLGEEEYRTTVKVASIKDPATTNEQVVTNPPKVGPTTDLLLGLLIFAMMMYMVMRFRRIR